MEPILIVIAVLILALVIGFAVRKAGGGPDPENPVGSRGYASDTGTEDGEKPEIPPYPTGSRPGGPGAESMNPAEPGGPAPGPTSDAGTDDVAKPSDAARKPLDDDER